MSRSHMFSRRRVRRAMPTKGLHFFFREDPAAQISTALATHQLAKGLGGFRRALEQSGDAVEVRVLEDEPSRDERLLGQLLASFHEVEQRLLHHEAFLEPVA